MEAMAFWAAFRGFGPLPFLAHAVPSFFGYPGCRLLRLKWATPKKTHGMSLQVFYVRDKISPMGLGISRREASRPQ